MGKAKVGRRNKFAKRQHTRMTDDNVALINAVMEKCCVKRIKPEDFPLGQPYEAIRWKGRDAIRLTNGIVELISLTGGGHLAAFRFVDQGDRPPQNVLWEAPWTTFDPGQDWSQDMSRLYGPPQTGKFLAGFTGHALCLDYFGDPTAEKAAAGLSLHGEAAIVRWSAIGSKESRSTQCRWQVSLPISQLIFEREIHLGNKQSVAYIEETVSNERDVEHRCDWVQHVTFGPPLVCEGVSTLIASAQFGLTSPSGYEGGSLLPNNRHFSWPYVRRSASKGPADLRLPLTEKGQSFLAGLMLDPAHEIEFLLAVNWSLRLGVGYCFRRRDFPWMAVWEENCTRQDPPWNGNTQARGMEFGTRPLPLAGNGGLPGKRFLDIPRGCSIAAHGKKTARYMMFLFEVPEETRSIGGAAPAGNAILVHDKNGTHSFSIPAEGCREFLG